MSPLHTMFALVFGVVLFVNEVSSIPVGTGMEMRVLSKAEILASMTPESALQTVVNMSRTRDEPDLVAWIQSTLGGGHKMEVSQLQTKLRGTITGTSADSKAEELLNKMLEDTQLYLEEEKSRCKVYNRKTDKRMERMRDAVSEFNSKAAGARSRVVSAQGEIGSVTTSIVHTQEDFRLHKRECRKTLKALADEIVIVKADIQVMMKVLALTQCKTDGDALFLIQCNHCGGEVMLQHGHLQGMLKSLRSHVARDYVRNGLAVAYDGSLGEDGPVALTQADVERMRVHGRYSKRRLVQHSLAALPGVPGALNTSDVPTAPQPVDCQPTTKCTIGSSPQCEKLRDRFLTVQAAAVDKQEELEEEMRVRQSFCVETSNHYTASLEGMHNKLREEQAKLAVATEEQTQAEAGSHSQSQQHDETAVDYTKTMTTCCTNQNTATSELCALGKIRGELLKLQKNDYVVDCEVSDWVEEECTVTCGGGTLLKKRSIITQPTLGGVACPPLTASEPCNEEECPVDCVVGEWGGWSDCSAECGGGVQERTRKIIVEPAHYGEPCEDTEEGASCNVGSCNIDCVLSEWSAWSTCSKECGGGTLRRTRSIAVEAHGAGKCWEPEDDERLEFAPCNEHECQLLLPNNRTILECKSKIDLIILLDGSASLGVNGWEKSREMAKTLVEHLDGKDDTVKVALEVFSGPTTWANYWACTRGTSGTLDMKAQCGMEWVESFTNDTEALATKVADWKFPRATTLTSVALGQAESMLMRGREDANTKVLVITDGWPMSHANTKAASERLQKKAEVLWVPVGKNAPLKMIKELASKPQAEHIIEVNTFQDMVKPDVLNKIISTTCPNVG